MVALIVLSLLLVACGGTRPTTEEWLVTWDETVALIPDETSLGEDPPEEQCETVLASLRKAQEIVIPTSDESLDVTVNEWLMVAEGAFFECPPAQEGFAGSYKKLTQLEDEVEAFLASG